MDGDEEVLGNPRLPRPVRATAMLLAGAAIATLIALHAWPSARHAARTAPPAPMWPQAAGACGGTPLPFVSSTRPAERTGIRVLLGGDRLRTVDFDTGRWRDTPTPHVQRGDIITAVEPGYLATTRCSGGVRVLHGAAGTVVARGGAGLLAAHRAVIDTRVVPLGPGRAVRLPADFQPEAVAGSVVAGQDLRGLVLVDATTGRVQARLGQGAPVAGDDRMLLWTGTCENPANPCPVHRRMLGSGATTHYVLPRSPRALGGAISHDGTMLAFTLRRAQPDPRFAAEGPWPPADVATLRLDTGRVGIVPGIELPSQGSAGLAFSADDRWLVIALNAGSTTRLLAWRPGLARPYECAPVPAQALGTPPVEVLGVTSENR